MTPKSFADLWNALALPLASHLLQSTLFALAAALLTLSLRKNHARVRYWLWLAASLKFFIPFSFLVVLGGRFAWSPSAAVPSARVYSAMNEAGQALTASTVSLNAALVSAPTSSSPTHSLPLFIAILWLCGFLTILTVWCMRWLKMAAVVCSATPLHEGREVEALRRMKQFGRINKPIEILLSPTSLEPGIFGILRPVLLWPQGISNRLTDEHLQAIVAHEVWHVRRRDNLAAVLHMLVEAVFWFHPLVWWLGARLIAERERACDEHVLELGSECQVYAESILKTCEFCTEFPLPCVSGVAGADLKKRIVHIMTARTTYKLGFGKKLLLAAAAMITIAVPMTFGLLRPSPVHAESQELKPSVEEPQLQEFMPASQPITQATVKSKAIKTHCQTTDKAMMKNIIHDLQRDQIISHPDDLDAFLLSDTALVVNGTQLPDDLRKTLRDKYLPGKPFTVCYGDVHCSGRGSFIILSKLRF